MTLLNQIIALRAGAQDAADKATAAARQNLASGEALKGIIRRFSPLDDDAPEWERPPDEGHQVQVTAADMLDFAAKPLSRLYDLEFTREAANGEAKAAVVLADGTILLPGVPAPFLLFLEREVKKIMAFVEQLPRLLPGDVWHPDLTADRPGAWRSEPAVTLAKRKQRVNWTRFAGDEHHPPQVDVYDDDVIIGRWEVTKLSGAMPVDDIRAMHARAADLLAAVIRAREEANSMTVRDRKAGAVIFGFLLGQPYERPPAAAPPPHHLDPDPDPRPASPAPYQPDPPGPGSVSGGAQSQP